MNTIDVLLLANVTLGRKVKLARVARDLTQWEVAALATDWVRASGHRIKIQPVDVGYLEREWGIPKHRKQAILAVLGLEDSDGP